MNELQLQIRGEADLVQGVAFGMTRKSLQRFVFVLELVILDRLPVL